MKEIKKIRQYAEALRLTRLKNETEKIIHEAQIDKPSYLEFTSLLLEREVEQRQKNDFQRRLKLAKLPKDFDLDGFDYNHSMGITKPQLVQLRELIWMQQNFNLILMGPSGTGKTFIASGLIYEAVKMGYRAYFTTMENLISLLNMKDLTGSHMNAYNRLARAHLVAIDDIMLLPMKKNDAVSFFNLINHLHEKTSIIITTNKSPKQWAETLDDEVLATALLDRILFRCEVIKLKGNSYRMQNRKMIFS